MDASYFTHFKKETTTKICSIRIQSLYMRGEQTPPPGGTIEMNSFTLTN